MKRVLIICYSPLHRDPRVSRQIETLAGHVTLVTAGYSEPNVSVEKHIQILKEKNKSFIKKSIAAIATLLGFIEILYWTDSKKRDLKNLLKVSDKLDWVIANDLETIGIAIAVCRKNHAKLIFDAHEYFPGYLQDNSWKLIFRRIRILKQCKSFLPKVDYFTVVSLGIKKLYEAQFNLKPVVITNATSYKNLEPTFVSSDDIQLVHHGIAAPARKTELMIEMMNLLNSRFSLHLYLLETPDFEAYHNELIQRAIKSKSKIIFHKIVDTESIPKEINKYDVGVYLLPHTNINHKYALPNKFFEFIQARLAIAIGPSVEMKVYVDRYQLGIVSEDFSIESFSNALNRLTTEKIMDFKMNSDLAANELCAEENMKYDGDLILNE